MLRDRLASVGSELVDARNRVTELENAQVVDRAALRESSHSLTNAGMVSKVPACVSFLTCACLLVQQLCDLSALMKQQQHERYDILSIAAETDAKLCASNERYVEVKEAADTSGLLTRVYDYSIVELTAALAAKDSELAGLSAVQNQSVLSPSRSQYTYPRLCSNNTLSSLIADREARIASLEIIADEHVFYIFCHLCLS